MSKLQSVTLFALRLIMGWFYFYAGITKVLDPQWTSAGYVKGAASFTWFFNMLLNSQVLTVVDFLVKWGLVLLGVSLVLGLFVRLSSYLGALLMFLLYLPVLKFPMAGAHAYIVDEHIIYIGVLFMLAHFQAGKVWGLDRWVRLRN
jgi:thiosulfate dehydrogenase [quinone] large subunit